MEEQLTLSRAASLLGVSPATVRNWRKAGLLSSLTRESVTEFLTKRKGENRLKSRANKSGSDRVFTPAEYGSVPMGPILAFVGEQGWNREQALYYAMEDLTSLYGEKPENPFFDREMGNWKRELNIRNRKRPSYPPGIGGAPDFPGRLYQSLIREGEKSVKGSYYTPEQLAGDILSSLLPEGSRSSFYDPCCGAGMFLCLAALRMDDPELVSGQDIDPLAVRLSRLNLMRLFPHRHFEPAVHVQDSLDGLCPRLRERKFDVIATNPPWGFRFCAGRKEELEERFSLRSGESASAVILAVLPFLMPEGRAGFLLPESLLHRDRHRDIREILLERTEIVRWYGNRFTRVQSECCALFLGPRRDDDILIEGTGPSRRRSRESLRKSPLGVWNIFTGPEEERLFQKLYAGEHRLLGDGSRWGLGIVTGNNREQLFEAADAPEGSEAIRSGSELAPFSAAPPRYALRYDDGRIQQKAPRELYGEEKILYRFIARHPIAALDREGLLTLNSVNFLIPPPGYSPEVVVMLLNSRLYRIYFEKSFHTIKILRRQLETLPLPLLTGEESSRFQKLFKKLQDDYKSNGKALDDLVYGLFRITHKEREYLESTL
jgi:SAM-dependent methyltransferase